MGYRFTRITDYYPQYLNSYYSKNPDAHLLSYEEQYKSLTSDSFEIVSSYNKNLNKIPGVDATGIITNATLLQQAWCKENKVSTDIPKQQLILLQLQKIQPDVLWIDDFSLIDEAWKKQLLQKVPSIKLLIGHICAPYNDETALKFKLFDIMFTCIPCLKTEIEKMGVNAYLLYHGFEKTILERINDNNKFSESPFLFSGSLYTGAGFHNSRIDYIEKMLQAGIKMDLYCNLETYKKVFAKKVFYYLINFLKAVGLKALINKIPLLAKNKAFGETKINYYSKKLLSSTKSPVFGLEMYQLLSKAKITFNIHGEVANKCAGNIRLFEATGIGSCLVTDHKDNISDLFEPGKEIITYNNVDDCIKKVKWLIENPAEREKIAKAGQKRTLEYHTIEKRSNLVNEIIENKLKKQII